MWLRLACTGNGRGDKEEETVGGENRAVCMLRVPLRCRVLRPLPLPCVSATEGLTRACAPSLARAGARSKQTTTSARRSAVVRGAWTSADEPEIALFTSAGCVCVPLQ